MRTHKRKFAQAKAQRAVDELSTFWLRKTRKIVLAVLMVQSPSDEAPRFYRGMNLEVSMPTGSLCAERNVIGNALASEPGLRRQDLRCIAVLSMTLDPPPAAASGHVSLAHAIGGTATPQLLTPMSATPVDAPLFHKAAGSPDRNLLQQQRRRPRSHSSADSVNSSSTLPPYAVAPPANKYPGELNPILPCGACNEWLKKIAEVNPMFKVMTFPNSDCLEAFIQEIAD
jgi:cytidine deaminase